MSLDVSLVRTQPTQVFEANITHNLGKMASAVGLYHAVWRPEEIGITTAQQLITPLKAGIAMLESNPEMFRALDDKGNWGTYDQFLPWLKKYLAACEAFPDASVDASR